MNRGAQTRGIGQSPAGMAKDVAQAVAAAEAAWAAWVERSPAERGAVLRELGRRLSKRAEELLWMEVAYTGNTIKPMRGDAKFAVDAFDYYAGLGYEQKGHTVPSTRRNLYFSVRESYGVVGRIVSSLQSQPPKSDRDHDLRCWSSHCWMLATVSR